MKEKFYGFRQRLSQKRWFRFVADKAFPDWLSGLLIFLFLMGIPSYVTNPPEVFNLFDYFWLVFSWAGYLMATIAAVIHTVDVYDLYQDHYRFWAVLGVLGVPMIWFYYAIFK